MLLKVKNLKTFAGGKKIVIINEADLHNFGTRIPSRLRISYKEKTVTAIPNVTKTLVEKGFIGLYEEVSSVLKIEDGEEVDVSLAPFPESLNYIKKKLKGKKLEYEEFYKIVKDAVEGNLTEAEIASFVVGLHAFGLDLNEAASLSMAMVETGEKLELNKKMVLDKHSVSYETPIIIKENGLIRIVEIGKFVDEIIEKSKNVINFPDGSQYCRIDGDNYEVLAFDENLSVNFRRLTGVYRHPSPERLIRIHLLGNRFVDVTECHSVFRLKDGKVESVPTREIKVGDYLAVPRKLVENDAIKEINLIEEILKLPEEETSEIYVTGLSKKKLIRRYLDVNQKMYDLTPINLLRKIKVSLPKDKVKIKIKHGKPINAFIKVNREFARLIGYYVAEGFSNEIGVFISFGRHEKELIDDAKKCIKECFGINATQTFPHKTAVHICIYNKLLSFIFDKIFKIGKCAENKRIPDFIFNISPSLQLEFIKAYFKGDGYIRRGYEAIAVTISKELVTQLMFLLSNLGFSFSISKKPPGIRAFPWQTSQTKERFSLYTQANKLIGKNSNTAAYLNFIPIRETNLHLIAHNPLIKGWVNRRRIKTQKYITFLKLQELLQKYVQIERATEEEMEILTRLEKISKGEIGFLPVKKIEEIESKSKYVYDLCVENYENFVGGFGPIFLHNSIGGGIGDKTSMLLVPIIASLGYTIPKTSSRAITSPAGTADKVETIMPVDLTIEEMKKVVEKTNGCLVWGGALHLAPADDIFIRVEYPLEIDPLLFPSIMAKKKAVGATHLVIDIPTGRGAKIKTIGDAQILAKDFITLGSLLNIKVNAAITYGEQPIGYSIGAGLEAKEALEILMRRKIVEDQVDKVTNIAGILLEMVGEKNGKELAMKVLESGKAEEKFREIIEAQGGNPEIKPEDIPIGRYTYDFTAEEDGFVIWIDNGGFASLARAAGSPIFKGAGIVLYKKVGDIVKKGEKVFTIYAESESKLEEALRVLKEETIIGIGKKRKMLIEKIEDSQIAKKRFILER